MGPKGKKTSDSAKGGNLSAHEKFDQLIDEYYSDLKDDRKKEECQPRCTRGDHVFKSVERDKADYARLDENGEPPPFTDLVPNEAKFGTVKITNPLPKVERRDQLKEGYMQWLTTEKLMRPNERRLEYEQMQEKYLETLKLSEDIKKDVKLARVVKSHYPRGIVGVDSIYSENTVLYKDKYEEHKSRQEVREKKMKERAEALEWQNNRNGNFLAFEADNK
ncbi:unnamed protein product [Plasmodium vivax]|uniref:(malaria parasite P. vivax) hypothetical protein n=1 Tax=Plasmodium vivax TaxID=5855 RepID=A0A1G4GVE0_PLAVI|nr:unnamed protein product [Plasmodium vivax]CAI7719691.1 conserved Plasmodium protein, unknown function [Plasmodium vivax]SCO66572.1 conserved Plasmodium protein, unknown function [Plasmodium vivax]